MLHYCCSHGLQGTVGCGPTRAQQDTPITYRYLHCNKSLGQRGRDTLNSLWQCMLPNLGSVCVCPQVCACDPLSERLMMEINFREGPKAHAQQYGLRSL